MRFMFTLLLTLLISLPAQADQLHDAKAASDRQDYKTALNLLQPLADQGNAEAQYEIGEMYEHGNGLTQSRAEALKWYHRAAEKSFASAKAAEFALLKQELREAEDSPEGSNVGEPLPGTFEKCLTTDTEMKANAEKYKAAFWEHQTELRNRHAELMAHAKEHLAALSPAEAAEVQETVNVEIDEHTMCCLGTLHLDDTCEDMKKQYSISTKPK